MSEIAVITGGTSGIGRATALYLRDAGYTVYELSRREQWTLRFFRPFLSFVNSSKISKAIAPYSPV